MKCPRCQQENPPPAKFCLECATPLGTGCLGGLQAPSYADVTSRLHEALEQQAATAEILRVISSSPTDIEPVLASVVESAARLCQATDVSIFRVEGARMRLVIHRGPLDAAEVGRHTIPVDRGSVNGEAVLECRTVHVTDLKAETDRYPAGSAQARRLGWHTTLSAPLLREKIAIGVIVLRRAEIRPFTDKQLALLESLRD